jgi:predicted lipid-binding transport protein (Tim44 family)
LIPTDSNSGLEIAVILAILLAAGLGLFAWWYRRNPTEPSGQDPATAAASGSGEDAAAAGVATSEGPTSDDTRPEPSPDAGGSDGPGPSDPPGQDR